LAASVAALDLAIFWDRRITSTATQGVGVIIYGLAGYSALLFRRRAPVVVFIAIWFHSLIALQLPGYHPTLALLVAVYSVAAYRTGWTVVCVSFATLIPNGFTVVEETRRASASQRGEVAIIAAVIYAGLVFMAAMIGYWVSQSRRRMLELEERRRAAAREAVQSERARLARELHDIVAHSVTVMVLQAAGARRILERNPANARKALDAIQQTGTEAMNELRRLLMLLRAEDDTAENDAARRPRLADLDELVERVARTGVTVMIERRGKPRRVDPSVELAGFRVVQEALTNVTRHAGRGSHARVVLEWSDGLTVEVTNDTVDSPPGDAGPPSTGHGLLGLRERVAVAGGRLEAGPLSAGGFRVTASFPLGPDKAKLTTGGGP
jgi:signal transduction histidine kinase